MMTTQDINLTNNACRGEEQETSVEQARTVPLGKFVWQADAVWTQEYPLVLHKALHVNSMDNVLVGRLVLTDGVHRQEVQALHVHSMDNVLVGRLVLTDGVHHQEVQALHVHSMDNVLVGTLVLTDGVHHQEVQDVLAVQK